jgi:phospholipid transport system substrate-binding protein
LPGRPLARRRVLVGALLVGLLALPAWAAASRQAVEGAVVFIDGLGARAIQILRATGGSLEQRESRFRGLLSNSFDMAFISRFVLGKHWRRATPQQRADYQALFSEFVLKTYSRRLGGYAGERFKVNGARAAGKRDVMVRTLIVQPGGGPPIKADWRVRPRDGAYKIIDVMVEGVSMAVTQRSEFNAVIRKQGIPGLLHALRARTEKFGVTS